MRVSDGPFTSFNGVVEEIDEEKSRPHEIVRAFWDGWRKYGRPCLVTFNGRGFDVPFLYLRSAVLNVPIARKDWLGYRYATEPHCDLAEQLTFYGVSGRDGAARKFNLDFYCKAFGIESPKAQGVTGMDVSDLVAQGRPVSRCCRRANRETSAANRRGEPPSVKPTWLGHPALPHG